MTKYSSKKSSNKCSCGSNCENGLPGTPALMYKDCGGNTFILEMIIWQGNQAVYWKLYENDEVMYEGCLEETCSRPQSESVTIECKEVGVYNYKCEVINCCGSTFSNILTVNITKPSIWYPFNLKATPYEGDLIVITWDKVCCAASYDLEIDGVIINDVTSPYFFKPETNSVYTFRIRSKGVESISQWSPSVKETIVTNGPNALPDRVLVGYWQNYNNGHSKKIKLREVSSDFDIIHIAFGEIKIDQATIGFCPYNESAEEFISDIKYLQSKGKKVCISIGGENGYLVLSNKEAEDKFVNSIIAIISAYGFNGVDLHLEGGSISLNAGDKDFKSPTTPKIVHLINAMKRIAAIIGDDFILTMSPEISYVQGGLTAYSGVWGAYLPIIYGLRDELTLLHCQNYNTGSALTLDGNSYTQGTTDFQVAMEEMLLYGFPVANNINCIFPPLPQYKVALGLPASPAAVGGGYLPIPEIEKALNYLILGKGHDNKYNLRNHEGYKGFRGLMTWSINWDASYNYDFSKNGRAYLNNLPRK